MIWIPHAIIMRCLTVKIMLSKAFCEAGGAHASVPEGQTQMSIAGAARRSTGRCAGLTQAMDDDASRR
jgi:hypothetical protein